MASFYRAHLLNIVTGFPRRFTLGFGEPDIMFCVLQIVLDRDEIPGTAGLSGQCFVLRDDLVQAAPDPNLGAMPIIAARTSSIRMLLAVIAGRAVLTCWMVGRAVWSHRDRFTVGISGTKHRQE